MTETEALRDALRRTGNVEGFDHDGDDPAWPTADAIEFGLATRNAAVVTAEELAAALIDRNVCEASRAPALADELMAAIAEART